MLLLFSGLTDSANLFFVAFPVAEGAAAVGFASMNILVQFKSKSGKQATRRGVHSRANTLYRLSQSAAVSVTSLIGVWITGRVGLWAEFA